MEGSDEAWHRVAARNNAEWCAAMCRSHRLENGFGETVWSASRRTPIYYPDAVTLAPAVDVHDVLDRIDLTAPGASVKDSFADLDLAAAGFGMLFEARWILGEPRPATGAEGAGWAVVQTVDRLRDWALAWDAGAGNADLFRPELLDEPDVTVLAGCSGGRVVAGAVAHLTGDVVGLSNLFASDGDTTSALAGGLDLLHRLHPTRAVVGYERGDDLTVALQQGFRPIGPLRVWVASGAE